jgi:hypothetical protein
MYNKIFKLYSMSFNIFSNKFVIFYHLNEFLQVYWK